MPQLISVPEDERVSRAGGGEGGGKPVPANTPGVYFYQASW